MNYDSKYYDERWSKTIKLLPVGGQYRFDLRQYSYDILKKEIGKNKKVFDYACGLGIIDIQMEGINEVYGCDISKVAIDYIKDRIENKERFFVGSKISDMKFDYVIAIHFLEHLKNPLLWLHDTLKKCKKVICVIPNNFNRYGEHINMAWSDWDSFYKMFNVFKTERIDEYPNIPTAFKAPVIMFQKKGKNAKHYNN